MEFKIKWLIKQEKNKKIYLKDNKKGRLFTIIILNSNNN